MAPRALLALALLAALALAGCASTGPAGTSSSTTQSSTSTPSKAPQQPVTVTGMAQFPCPQCTAVGANTGAGYRAGQSGVDSFFTAIGPELANRHFALASTGGDPNASFRDSCSGGAAVGDPFAGTGPESGDVPEGATCLLLWEDQATNSSFTFTVT